MTKENCTFCQIAKGHAPAAVVMEDDRSIAFLDNRPIRPGSTVVISKQHVNHFTELDEDTATHLIKVANRLALTMCQLYTGTTPGLIVPNSGIAHAQLHVLPLFEQHDLTSQRFLAMENGRPHFSCTTIEKVPLASRLQIATQISNLLPVNDEPPLEDFPCLETERLKLRPFQLSDTSELQRLVSDPAIATTTTIPHPYKDGLAESFIRRSWVNARFGRGYNWAVTRKQDDQLIGSIGIGNNRSHLSGTLGYWIARDHWDQGFCTEVAQAVVRFGFETLGLNRISANHFGGNEASGRVMQKLGMQYEGSLRQAFVKDDRANDLVEYGILREEWTG
ncbi:MAG: GNAT family N-acetyltransferase [Gammaproteobacteria bacterium]|nr:GNAT family N-acetyltransferase [Gammaproteobacteria bacterium]